MFWVIFLSLVFCFLRQFLYTNIFCSLHFILLFLGILFEGIFCIVFYSSFLVFTFLFRARQEFIFIFFQSFLYLRQEGTENKDVYGRTKAIKH